MPTAAVPMAATATGMAMNLRRDIAGEALLEALLAACLAFCDFVRFLLIFYLTPVVVSGKRPWVHFDCRFNCSDPEIRGALWHQLYLRSDKLSRVEFSQRGVLQRNLQQPALPPDACLKKIDFKRCSLSVACQRIICS